MIILLNQINILKSLKEETLRPRYSWKMELTIYLMILKNMAKQEIIIFFKVLKEAGQLNVRGDHFLDAGRIFREDFHKLPEQEKSEFY